MCVMLWFTVVKYVIAYVSMIYLTYGIQQIYYQHCVSDIFLFLFAKGSPMCNSMEYIISKNVTLLQFAIAQGILGISSMIHRFPMIRRHDDQTCFRIQHDHYDDRHHLSRIES